MTLGSEHDNRLASRRFSANTLCFDRMILGGSSDKLVFKIVVIGTE